MEEWDTVINDFVLRNVTAAGEPIRTNILRLYTLHMKNTTVNIV
jgi:hypothetical protein